MVQSLSMLALGLGKSEVCPGSAGRGSLYILSSGPMSWFFSHMSSHLFKHKRDCDAVDGAKGFK